VSANTQPRFDRAQTPQQDPVIARLQHGFAAHLLSEPLTVTRWLMYGQARLYVKTQQGTPIGWVDVRTGERVIEVPELQPAFEAAIAAVQPGIPAAYTPRRAQLESVESPRRPKGDGPAPQRVLIDPDQPLWTAVERPKTASPRSQRSARTQSKKAAATKVVASSSTELAVITQEPFQFGRLDAMMDRYQLWRGATPTALVARQLNALGRRDATWDYLSASDLGIEDAVVDFLVGGPAGVFAIDVITPTTAHFPGAGLAKRASEVLTRAMNAPIWVRHVLVPVGFSAAEAALLPTELPLVTRRRLPSYLLAQPTLLDSADVELALGYARLRWTWRG
jgi:hypothetical protein